MQSKRPLSTIRMAQKQGSASLLYVALQMVELDVHGTA